MTGYSATVSMQNIETYIKIAGSNRSSTLTHIFYFLKEILHNFAFLFFENILQLCKIITLDSDIDDVLIS